MKRLKFDNPIECSGCGACAAICPRQCIKMKKDSLHFNIPHLEKPEECIDCGLCFKVCPQVKKRENELQKSIWVYGQNKNREICHESSSGGAFSLLATYVLEKDGYVWGVELQSDGFPCFACVHDKSDLARLRGSKYTEVKEPMPFKQIKQQLKEEKYVLVSGTPCQILSLRNFLGSTDYPNLLLVDLLCYGIQSPKMWKLYLQDVNPHNKSISHISMRNKHISWFNYSMKINFEDGTEYKKIRYKDPWLLTYSTSIFNRLSCSDCQSKKSPHVSDFTIGDFWDIDYYKHPIKLNKKQGVSLVMLHTQKAIELFKAVNSEFVFDYIPEKYIEKRSMSLAKSSPVNSLRDKFIQDACKIGFTNAVCKYMDSGVSLWYKKRKNYLRHQTIGRIKSIVKTIISYKKNEN